MKTTKFVDIDTVQTVDTDKQLAASIMVDILPLEVLSEAKEEGKEGNSLAERERIVLDSIGWDTLRRALLSEIKWAEFLAYMRIGSDGWGAWLLSDEARKSEYQAIIDFKRSGLVNETLEDILEMEDIDPRDWNPLDPDGKMQRLSLDHKKLKVSTALALDKSSRPVKESDVKGLITVNMNYGSDDGSRTVPGRVIEED